MYLSRQRSVRLAGAAGAGVAALAAWYIYQQQAKPKKRKRSKPDVKHIVSKAQAAQYFQALLRSLFGIGGAHLAGIAALTLVRTALLNYQGKRQGDLFRAAFLRHVSPFTRLLVENVLISLAASSVERSGMHLQSLMAIYWRGWLTRRLHAKYFANMAYYQLSYVDRRIADPEQIICEDAAKLARDLADTTGALARAAVDAAFYSVRMWQYTGTHAYTAALAAYILAAGSLTALVQPNFSGLVRRTQELEGAYRAAHEALRANAEPVALLGGVEREAEGVRARFGQLLRHTRRVLAAQLYSGVATDFLLKYLGATAAVLLIIGPFFAGDMKPEATLVGRAQMLSNMRYHTSVVISLFQALGTLGVAPRKVAKIRGYAGRLCAMEAVLDDTRAAARDLAVVAEPAAAPAAAGEVAMRRVGSRVAAEADEISFEKVTVITPTGNTLVKGLTLRVPMGTNLLVTGPNGAGKSSLFRVLGGLWPLQEGVIRKPDAAEDGLSHHIFYVPQRPYVMAGTLIEQLIYPLTVEQQAQPMSEAEAAALVAGVDLQHLAQRHGYDVPVQWNEVLSLGEQQRLGMARLMFHKPRFAVLDECTSGVTTDMEQRFTDILKRLGCTCITISHRPTLVAFHDLVLALDGDGGWQILPGHRKRESGGGGGGGGGSENFLTTVGATPAAAARLADARLANTKMLESAGMSAEEEEGGARRRVVRAVLPRDGMTVAASAGAAYNAALMAARLAPVRARPPRATLAQWRHIAGVVCGARSGMALARQFAGIGGIVVLRTLLQDRIARLNGRTVEYVVQQDRAGFLRLVWVSVLQSLGSALLAPLLRYTTDALALTWRRRLTERVHEAYLHESTSAALTHLAGMHDGDQRLTGGVDKLATDLADLVPSLVKPVVDILWFSWSMGRLTGLTGLGGLYGYMAAGFLTLHCVAPDFGGLAKRTHALEATFRKAHHYLKQHAESIAFFGGASREGAALDAHLGRFLTQERALARARWLHSVVDEFFSKQLPHNVTWAMTLLYALQRGESGWVDAAAQGKTVFAMRYLATVVANCFTAFGDILQLQSRLFELSGGVARVSELLDAAHAADALQQSIVAGNVSPEGIVGDPTALLRLDSLSVVTPGGATLVKHCSLHVRLGCNLLVTGPNGAGKSSLFRILRGLWPNVRGAIHVAGGRRSFDLGRDISYVPQQPYLSHASLLEQLIYPLSIDDALAKLGHTRGKIAGKGDALAKLHARCAALMAVVKLSYLAEREGWAAVKQWGTVLSLGEQQRMGMARLFFQKPALAVLDECTNATSVDVERGLYEHAATLGITVITVTQRPALTALHQQELKLLDGRGHWQLCELEHPSS